MIKLTKEERTRVKDALVRTLSDNFPILSEAQIDGIAEHFKTHMSRVIAKCDNYAANRTFTTDDMKNAFAEVLAKRILHINSLNEQPPTQAEAEDSEAEEA